MTGGSLVLALAMIAGLLLLVAYQGGTTFWPEPLVQLRTLEGDTYLGEVRSEETFLPTAADLARMPEEHRARIATEREARDGEATRTQLRTGNYELTGVHFRWVEADLVEEVANPEWAITVERRTWGRFYGTPIAFRIDGEVVAEDPEEVWARYEEFHPAALARHAERVDLEEFAVGELNRSQEAARLAIRGAELEHGVESTEYAAAVAEFEAVEEDTLTRSEELGRQIAALEEENARFEIVLGTSDGREKAMVLSEIVRAYPPNRLGFGGKLSVYFSRSSASRMS